MTDFLSEEWFAMAAEAAADLPVIDGLNAELMLEIAGAPSGKLRATATITEGQIATLVVGKNAAKECTLIAPAEMAASLLRREADAEVAYMRGDVKLDGAYERVLFDLRPLLSSAPWSAFLDTVAAKTTF